VTNGFDAAYFAALAADHDLGSTRGIDAALQQHNLDALVLPATGFTTVPPGKLYIERYSNCEA
jgi:amidase